MIRTLKVRDEAKVEACRKLYMKYGGLDHRRIEKEMRAAGWTFSRVNLNPFYDREGNIRSPGWVARFGWKKELARREKAKAARAARKLKTFEKWLETASPEMRWTARHHVFICEHLKRITAGELKRLMIFVPPRHGKSELVTVRYALWRMARNPKLNIIIGCYNQKLANRFSRKIKKLAGEKIEISKSRYAAEEWETAVGGSVKAVGVGAGITGFGGGLVIIDDPVKGRAVANSRTFREKTWDWYKDDIHTRLEPGAAVILIQTRWHDDDLAGRLLKDMAGGGEQWEVVSLPALAEGKEKIKTEEAEPASSPIMDDGVCEATPSSSSCSDPLGRVPGEALWPERFGREDLLAIERRLGARSFAALYQQRPLPEGGAVFKFEWFARTVTRAPEGLHWARGYDLAVSLKDSADYTASFRVGLDKKTGDVYIADGFRKRLEYPDQRRFVIEKLNEETDTRHGIELALHGKALIQDLRRDPRTAGRTLTGIKVDGDKLLRAEAWANLAEEGRIVLVKGAWIHDFIEEVCRFTGRGDSHDDQVDAVSIAMKMLNKSGSHAGF